MATARSALLDARQGAAHGEIRHHAGVARPLIEIFPEQKDFAVRTFGMPDNPGFLGVCFGPRGHGQQSGVAGRQSRNWEAVLWHEFCHVVTLQITKNKMPRWLSEGISVYEELQANPVLGPDDEPALPRDGSGR